VFQRLHLRDQYGGTGIGLALCRRIVEFHGGQIWLADVSSAVGATFRFTLPERGFGAQSRD
jgi:signal transduction histidine kinase